MGKLSKFIATIIVALAFTILTFSGSSASAKNVALTATVKDAVSITTGGDITFDLIPNQFNTGSTDVSVSTTNSTGYTLYVTSTGTDHSGDATTSLVHTSLTADSSNVIESLSSSAVVPYNTSTGTYDGSSFGTDKWGIYVFAAGTAESPITDTSTSRTFRPLATSLIKDENDEIDPSANANQQINSSNTQVQEDTTEVTVGAKAGLDILAGTYENTLTFTALANSVPYTYTINYSGNATDPAASIVPDATVYTVNDNRYPDVTITSTEPTRVGYDFLGWATTADGAVAYQPGGTISMDYEDPTITLYAKWVAAWDYELNYNANNGTGAPETQSVHSQNSTYDFTISSTEPTRSNHTNGSYTFLGWSESSSATTATYTAGDTITLNSANADASATISKTLYAVWQKNYNYTLNYSANGGSGAPSAQTTTSAGNGVFTVSSTKPTRTNYEFLGWSESSTATTASYTSGNTYTIVKSDTAGATTKTLYAVWKSSVPTTMQGFTASYCSSMSTGASLTLTDSRDSKSYTVKKLVDGKCWMTQNLRLVGSYTLTSSNSNVSSNFSLTATDGFSSYDVVRAYDTGSSSYGAYYNWYTATAGTGTQSVSSGNASSSICPKNWRLPTSTEWNTLYTSSGSSASNMLSTSGGYPGLVLSGLRDGYYWSSTAYNAYVAYDLGLVSSGGAYPQHSYSKLAGFTVRCVASS